MKENFQKVIPYIFSEEDGYVDNPRDPGGATNMGITLSTLSAWEGHTVSAADVKSLSSSTATKSTNSNSGTRSTVTVFRQVLIMLCSTLR